MTDDDWTPEQRALIDSLPDGSLQLSGEWVGDCVVEIVDASRPTERAVVTRADTFALASPQLVAQWRDATPRHVQLEHTEGEPDVVRFGTEGEGLGVVAYEIGERRMAPGEWDMHEIPTIPLRRVQ